jgi:hypothetical protein
MNLITILVAVIALCIAGVVFGYFAVPTKPHKNSYAKEELSGGMIF